MCSLIIIIVIVAFIYVYAKEKKRGVAYIYTIDSHLVFFVLRQKTKFAPLFLNLPLLKESLII